MGNLNDVSVGDVIIYRDHTWEKDHPGEPGVITEIYYPWYHADGRKVSAVGQYFEFHVKWAVGGGTWFGSDCIGSLIHRHGGQ